MAEIGLKTQIWNNNLRSMMLMVLYPLLLAGIVWGVSFAFSLLLGGGTAMTDPAAMATAIVAEAWPTILMLVIVWFYIAWFFNTRMVRMMTRAHPVTRAEEPELYNMLENMCIARGMKMPRLEIIESHARNAFASGVTEDSFTITLTRGLLNTLQPDEVEAVIGHELTHIVNRDVRLLMVCIIFTGMLGFLAQMAYTMGRHGFRLSSGRGGGQALFLLAIFVILYIGYLAGSLTRFAVSRGREFMADAGAVEMTKNPEAMMRALMRISGRDQIPEATDDIALMCIENTRPFLGLFATHPPIERRIAAIAQTTGAEIPLMAPHAPASVDARFQKPGDRAVDWITRARQQSGNPWR